MKKSTLICFHLFAFSFFFLMSLCASNGDWKSATPLALFVWIALCIHILLFPNAYRKKR